MIDWTIDKLIFSAESSIKINGGWLMTGPHVSINLPTTPVRYLYSGWQSWSLTAWVDTNHPIRPMRPSIYYPLQIDPVYARETRPHGSWYGAVELSDGQLLFLGGLGLESHIILDDQLLTGGYETGSGEWFLAVGEEDEIMARYAELINDRFGKGPSGKSSVFKSLSTPYRVWCSWYSLYAEINETRLMKILVDLGPIAGEEGLPFDVFQVDDGWQRGIGEWEPNSKFPSGMAHMAAQIHATGRKAGIWLAPLLVVPSSRIYREHRDWLLHNENGNLVSAGYNWGEPLYALDTTHPAVLEWLAALMKKVTGWGFDYVKLDFLYAGALPGKRFLDIAREAAYRKGLLTIRTALRDAYLLTCGAPILPSLGLCDGIRAGPDVAGHFSSHRDDNLLMNFSVPGARNSLRTTYNRLWLLSLVQIDPDVVYFRSRDINLTLEEKSLIQYMAQICNFKATSDVPAWLSDPERAALREFLISTPNIERSAHGSFLVDNHPVDFCPSIGLPGLPNLFTNIFGSLLGGLANIPVFLQVFEILAKYHLKEKIKQNPV
jgi:alpha-galactosidase